MRPSCPKCGGYMEPRYDLGDRVESVRCVNCGHNVWPEFRSRRPSADERNTKAVAKSRRATA